jgi:serine/threonine-protein kinase HipA
MTSEVLYVWAHLPGSADPVVAGRLEVTRTAAGPVGHFNYGQSYLSRSDAIPSTPLAAPEERCRNIYAPGGYPGVIMDAGPDLWGKRVIDRLKGPQAYPRGYLLLNDPGRSGCLSFSTRPDELPIPLTSRAFPSPNCWPPRRQWRRIGPWTRSS